MAAIDDYFATPEALRILLIEVWINTALGTRLYMSDTPYTTEASDATPNMRYSPVIGAPGLPEMRRTLGELWDAGNASTSFGNVSLVGDSVSFRNSLGEGLTTTTGGFQRGAIVFARMAAPRDKFDASTAWLIASGAIGRCSGSSAGGMTFEITDGTSDLAEKAIAIDPTVAPICWGYCRNITPFLIDPATLKYAVHDGPISDITAVYDQGALLTYPGQYTKNLAAGTFTLAASPVGVVTCDVQGAKPSGTWLQTTAQIAADVLSRTGYGGASNFSTLPTGTIGLYVTQSTTQGKLLDRLMQGCAGYWVVNRSGTLVGAQYPVPASGTVYDESSLLDEVAWTASDRLYGKLTYNYRTNWTTYQARPAATAAQAAFAAGTGLNGVYTASMSSDTTYKDSPPLNTLFDASSDALTLATRVSSIYSVPRKIMSTVVPYKSLLDLGSLVTLTFGGNSYNGAVIEVVDVFDGNYPSQKITVLS